MNDTTSRKFLQETTADPARAAYTQFRTMQFRTLGSTGIRVSALAFGAGPVPALMTSDNDQGQRDTLRRVLDAGINWIDTAATYGNGQSEVGLGQALRDLGALDDVHITSKVRLAAENLDDLETKVRQSVAGSLKRPGVSRITLLQLSNLLDAGPLLPEVIYKLESSNFRALTSSTPQ